jgi:hypothetical protein
MDDQQRQQGIDFLISCMTQAGVPPEAAEKAATRLAAEMSGPGSVPPRP